MRAKACSLVGNKIDLRLGLLIELEFVVTIELECAHQILRDLLFSHFY
jgi:hypothetical protein